MSLPEGKCERMGEQLAYALRHWNESDLPDYFPIDGQTIGSSDHEAWLSQWFSMQASEIEMASTIKNGLRITEYRALLGFTEFEPETFIRDTDPERAMLFAWFEHHNIHRPSEIFDSAWCIRHLNKIAAELFEAERNQRDLDSFIPKTRRTLERCLKIFLSYTWGLLGNLSPESFDFLMEEGKKRNEHQRFLNKIKSPNDLVDLLATGRREKMPMGRLKQTLNWTKAAVDLHGQEIINSFISDSWSISEQIFTCLDELNPMLNEGLHDTNDGKAPIEASDFYFALKSCCTQLERWGENKMLPRVAEHQWATTGKSHTIARMTIRTNPVVSATTKNEPKTIELMYENQEPPSSGEKVFLYCKDAEARVKNFYTFAVPAGAVETSPLLEGDDDL